MAKNVCQIATNINNQTDSDALTYDEIKSLKLTIPTIQEICGDDEILSVIKNVSASRPMTDLAVLTGGLYFHEGTFPSSYWLKQKISPGFQVPFFSSLFNAAIVVTPSNSRMMSICPVIHIEDSNLFKKIIKNKKIDLNLGVCEVELGEYPQYAITPEFTELAVILNKNKSKVNESFTFDKNLLDDFDKEFEPEKHQVFEYENKKFIDIIAKTIHLDEEEFNLPMNNRFMITNGKHVMVEILPIKWIVDEKKQTLISKYALLGGIRYDKDCTVDIPYEETELNKFLNEVMKKDMFQSLLVKLKEKEEIKDINGLDLSEVSEEDIIKGCVESDVSVFLHGKSSDGKSARVKQLDPNLEIIYLRNATPESLIGKSVYLPSVYKRVENPETKMVEEVLVESGHMEDIPPTWYINLVNKCKKEPNKIHILFLDELTNALPSIQSMAYNIVLDKEVNGKWKLPSNVRIVAAGNELEDSLAANELVEPMFNRFAHTYIETHVKDFIKWATDTSEYEVLDYEEINMPYKIHPIILAFISYKGDKVLRTKYNGKTPNADPRKWEMASRVLYKTKNPNMLRSLVGKELTNEFVHFCKTRVITIEDVLNGNYNEEELNEMDLGKKILTVNGMLSVDENNFEVIYEFVNKLGEEATRLFETLWAKDNLERLELIQELHQEKLKKKVIR